MQQLAIRFLGIVPLAIGVLLAPLALSQIETARIQGVVSDSTGAVIPGATVRFVHVDTGQEFNVSTGADGLYRSVPLRIGEYRVEYEAEGFKLAVRSGINLELQETAVIDVALEIGEVTEVVDVTADAVLLETTEATQGQVINNQRIVDMPLNGRDYIQLALLSAGAVRPIGGRFGGYSAGGQRTTQNNYTLDGVDNNGLQIAAQGRRAEVVKPSVDAIEEFKISTNAYSAESGRALGGTVNVSIKSGTNELHGTVFEFLRNEKLDAKNFFDSPTAPKPPFKRNQFGFSLGGPIKRNSTFLFGDFEGTRIRESATFVETIPTQEQLSGDFSGVPQTVYDPASHDTAANLRNPFPNNVIPGDRIDSVARKASEYYPAPNSPGLTQNWRTASPDNEDDDKWDVRLDQIFGASDNMFWRYSQQDSYVPSPIRFPSQQDGDGTEFNHRGQNMGLGWNHIFTPTLITNIKLGWNRIYTNRQALAQANLNQELGLTGVSQSLRGAARFNISGMRPVGTSNFTPNLIDSQNRQINIDTNWTKGQHSIKFGYSLQMLQSYLTNPQQELGQFIFNGNFSRQTQNVAGGRGGRPVADFLLGIPFRTDISNSVYMNLRAPWQHFYIQDEWRVNDRLTLNLGLRYEHNMPWYDKDNGISNFDIDTDPSNPDFFVATDGSIASRATLDPDLNNLAPRFGFAYRVMEKTVLRGGYGIFYANYEGTGGGQFLETNPPFHIKSQISTDSINPSVLLRDGVPDGVVTPERAVALRFSSFERDPPWPISQQWNFNIQQSLGNNTVWEIGYYGTKAQHLVNRLDGNYALPGPGNINSRRRYTSAVFPGTDIVVGPLAAMNRHEFNGNSLFHSFQTRLERRYSNGFTVLAAYVWSKNIGDVPGFSGSGNAPNSGIQNPLNRRAERSLDNQHRSHSLVSSYIYDLPWGEGRRWGGSWGAAPNALLGGWSVAGIVSAASGRPFGLRVRGNPANNGNFSRPNVVEGTSPHLARGQRDPERWFNTGAFVRNNDFEYGNAGRNVLIGPGITNWDFAVYKRFWIAEGHSLQFRFESFNFTNTPVFNFPNSEVGNNNFGRITGAGRPRNLQFGLKYIF